MKKLFTVFAMALLATSIGCSSAPKAEQSEPTPGLAEVPVEDETLSQDDSFFDSESSDEPQYSAMVEPEALPESAPTNDPAPTYYEPAPAYSSPSDLSLGASSSGRGH